jgi:hypothetical protein
MVDDALDHFRVGLTTGTSSKLRPTTEPPQPSKTRDAVRRKPLGLHHPLLAQARAAGIPLSLGKEVDWLSGRGHLADSLQGVVPTDLLTVLATIHQQLGGNAALLASKIGGQQPLPDLIHDELGCVIEVDEVQHFTTTRARTFDLYPETVRLGYSLTDYRGLVRQWNKRGDGAFAHNTASEFPNPGGRQAQRAYNDALRDLLAPSFTGHPVIRIAAPDRNLGNALAQLQGALEQLG